MTNKTILREIHRENKSINRNLQRLAVSYRITCNNGNQRPLINP